MHELISDQNWWWWWTQSNDPISCYGTPVERTNEIKAYAISLSIPLVYRSNWSDCRTESDSRSRPKPWSVQSGSASWDDCGQAFLDKLRASLFSTLCWNSIATPLHFFYFCLWNMCPRGLTFTWWGCYGLCQRCKPTELAHSFSFRSCIYFCLMARSTVFHSLNFPDNCPFSHSVLPVFSLPYWFFQLYISLWK